MLTIILLAILIQIDAPLWLYALVILRFLYHLIFNLILEYFKAVYRRIKKGVQNNESKA